MITRILKRIERAGFFLFFLALFLFAIGITQDIDILWYVGLAVLALILLTILVRARRDITGPPRQPRSPDDSASN